MKGDDPNDPTHLDSAGRDSPKLFADAEELTGGENINPKPTFCAFVHFVGKHLGVNGAVVLWTPMH